VPAKSIILIVQKASLSRDTLHRKGTDHMELIVINDNKLKIMLTAPDMAYYELEVNHLDYASKQTKAAFRHIFDDAYTRIGFNTDGERLFVQFYASKEGGGEIFVTKLGQMAPFIPDEPLQPPLREENPPAVLSMEGEDFNHEEDAFWKHICHSGANNEEYDVEAEVELASEYMSLSDTRQVVYAFDHMQDLLAVCRRLLRNNYRERSEVYVTEFAGISTWYLFLRIPRSSFRLPKRYAILDEYGREISTEGLQLYLDEYGKCVCAANGVNVLGML